MQGIRPFLACGCAVTTAVSSYETASDIGYMDGIRSGTDKKPQDKNARIFTPLAVFQRLNSASRPGRRNDTRTEMRPAEWSDGLSLLMDTAAAF